jgi:hypothetical protein
LVIDMRKNSGKPIPKLNTEGRGRKRKRQVQRRRIMRGGRNTG